MKIAILGIVGVPGRYGGFETLAENIARFHSDINSPVELTIWCSSKDQSESPTEFENSKLRYVPLSANGVESILYDTISLFQAVISKNDKILLLGVSGALMLPLIRLFSNVRIITNIDGIEWKREKWSTFPRLFLRFSEWAAVRFSHDVIADNEAIAEYVRLVYGIECKVIAYGGDHAIDTSNLKERVKIVKGLPSDYALSICRIEPENNIHIILDAISETNQSLVFIGNWNNSKYGWDLREKYADQKNLYLLDPIYDHSSLFQIRKNAAFYIHGHSAGGTNPSLVEMMHFGIPIFAFDCEFNKYTTEGKANYFADASELKREIVSLNFQEKYKTGAIMKEIASKRFTWDIIGTEYFELFEKRYS